MKRMMALTLILSMLSALLTGCGLPASASTELTAGFVAESVEGKPIDLRFRQGQMTFSLALLKASADEAGLENLMISPLSVSAALAMAANGADGEAAKQMLAVLGGYSKEELNGYLYQWMNTLPKDSLSIANAIWCREKEDFTVEKPYLQDVVSYYSAAVYQAPFDETTVSDINGWVRRNTDGMIDRLIDELKPETMLMLLNAIAFEAEWQEPYEKRQVGTYNFYNLDGSVAETELMRSAEGVYLSCGESVGFLKGYKNGRYAFGALLPAEGTDFEAFVKGLSADELLSCLERPQYRTVHAFLPKFKGETFLCLNQPLAEMGMPAPFEEGADFFPMSHTADLKIGEVLHKTFIEVDEAGTKAAAVTSVEMESESAMVDDEPVTVRLDRPFVYFIVDTAQNLPIFIGTMAKV